MRERRIEEMENYIINNKSVSLDRLCEVFGVSKNTIRRDINEIIARGKVKKVYGGVSVHHENVPPPFEKRANQNLDVKRAIGRAAAQFVEDGSIIYIDSGTTTCHLVDYLKDKRELTILTHSLDVITRAIPYPGLNVICLSGALNRETLSFTGHSTLDVLANYNVNKAFMAANGITVSNGATQSTSWEFEIKRSVIARSSENILMVESRKFDVVSLLTYCPLDGFDVIITEKAPSREFQEVFSESGGHLVLAKG